MANILFVLLFADADVDLLHQIDFEIYFLISARDVAEKCVFVSFFFLISFSMGQYVFQLLFTCLNSYRSKQKQCVQSEANYAIKTIKIKFSDCVSLSNESQIDSQYSQDSSERIYLMSMIFFTGKFTNVPRMYQIIFYITLIRRTFIIRHPWFETGVAKEQYLNSTAHKYVDTTHECM